MKFNLAMPANEDGINRRYTVTITSDQHEVTTDEANTLIQGYAGYLYEQDWEQARKEWKAGEQERNRLTTERKAKNAAAKLKREQTKAAKAAHKQP